ncbi:MAG: endonuclease/exonuclease/phosphatase family protein [Chthoniobacterales bacterium]|nr:endonuclease/exonuclease/phosphatase family protein [Chthoniobacterales bacterium]
MRCWVLLSVLFLSALQAQTTPIVEKPPEPVVIASYNVNSYLSMSRWIDGIYKTRAGKPLSEKKALANVLAAIHPKILGLSEIGKPCDLTDLQQQLHGVGLDYSYSEYVQGSDSQRHLALLSCFPITERHSQGLIPLKVNGATLYSPRGILDVTLALRPDYQLRLICVHLKAKVSVPSYSQSALREAEATFLHDYLHTILTANPKMPLLVMGDFNDTKNSKALLTILGTPNLPDSFQALRLSDDHGEYWTEYWKEADVYSRIDYILFNQAAAAAITQAHSGIARPSFWQEASDHCALFTELIPKKESVLNGAK